jgi:S-adenosylmethionine hydrolase
MAPVITLTTDFGTSDAYVASMKGVILSINPQASIVDISHTIEPQNVLQAAYIISTAHGYFPKESIHVVVVDPGVGSQRKLVILKTPSAFFLAPDNGVLSYIIKELESAPNTATDSAPGLQQRQLPKWAEAIAIKSQRYWRQPVSTTFHGRDILAPVAAHLSMGIPIHEFGERLASLNVLPIPRPYHDSKGKLYGQIIHIDHFGNLVTNIRDTDLPEGKFAMQIGSQKIVGLSQSYAEKEGLVAIVDSSGYLEIALKDGNAASCLGSKVGDQIELDEGKT